LFCSSKNDASARVQDVQPLGADAPQPAATKAQAKRKATKDTKAQPKRQKTVPSSPPQPALLSQSVPADAPEQTIDPSDQGTSSAVAPKQTIAALTQGMPSVIVFQKFTIDEFARKLSLFSTLINSAAEDMPSVDLADSH